MISKSALEEAAHQSHHHPGECRAQDQGEKRVVPGVEEVLPDPVPRSPRRLDPRLLVFNKRCLDCHLVANCSRRLIRLATSEMVRENAR